LLHRQGGVSLDGVQAILLQLVLPFAAGQAVRSRLALWVERHRALLSLVDRGAILLMVYSVFGEAVTGGLWQRVPASEIGLVALACAGLLATMLGVTILGARRLGFNRADEIAIVFCGSKKSLVAGIPLANLLFAGQSVGTILLPLMLVHQLQLIACALLARHYARSGRIPAAAAPPAALRARPIAS
jgi:sodium/bile acid cotransporter 7